MDHETTEQNNMESTSNDGYWPEIIGYNTGRGWIVCHTIPIIPKLQNIAFKAIKLKMTEINDHDMDVDAIAEAPQEHHLLDEPFASLARGLKGHNGPIIKILNYHNEVSEIEQVKILGEQQCFALNNNIRICLNRSSSISRKWSILPDL